MKGLPSAALLLGVVCGYAASLASEIAPPDQWKLGKGVSHVRKDGKELIVLNVKETEKAGRHYAEIPIDLSAHAGKHTAFSIRMRSHGWKQNKNERSRRGIRFMVTYRHPENGRAVWHHSWDVWDSVDWEKYSGQKQDDWREISFFSPLDEKISQATLLLGTENNSGTAEFDLSSFRARQPFREDSSDYICEYSDRVKNTPPLRGVNNSPNPLTGKDLETLKSWNANAVRYWISAYAWVFNGKDLPELRRRIEKRLENFDKIAPLAEKYGIKLILCYGLPPGGRRADASLEMQYDPKLADYYVKMWELIAQHCKGNKAVWGYDLINEPQQTTELTVDYLTLQRRAAEAIRRIDPDVPLIVESNMLASPEMFRFLEPLKMRDVIYQAHMYVPAGFTHMTLGPYPGEIRGEYWDKEALRKVLKPVADFQKRHKARIYIGEFSARARAVGADRYLRDCIDLFEEYGWDWTYHSFREAPTWDVEKEWKDGKHVPSAGNLRKTVLLNGLKKNR